MKNTKKIRIGYVSGDFRSHPVARFLEPILENHNHDRFAVYGYHNYPFKDESTNRLKGYFKGGWRNIESLSDADAWETIVQDRIDILIDLAGHTSHNRLQVFKKRAAPIQVTYLGHPGTTGLKEMDYRITDHYCDTVGKTEHWYTETLARMPKTMWCWKPPLESPRIRRNENEYPTYGCFNNIAKVTDESCHRWAEMMQEFGNKKSRFIFKNKSAAFEECADRIVNIFKSHGIKENRIEFRTQDISEFQHLSSYNDIDYSMDTFPYNGVTTSFESMWMGVPVIPSPVMNTPASRTGYSIRSNLGNATADGVALRNQLKKSPMMDAKKFTKDFESLLLSLPFTF